MFEGTSYHEASGKLAIQAFREEEDGSLRILRSDGRSVRINGQTVSQGHGEVETLKKTNVASERIPIVIINANSSHREGAWAFLEFLLGEEAQSAQDHGLPVLKQAFDEIAAEMLTHVEDEYAESMQVGFNSYVNGERTMVWRTLKDLTAEKVAELKATVEDARTYPIRTEFILDIIREEAAHYFDGTKDIDEVRRVIENRVRLYLEGNG